MGRVDRDIHGRGAASAWALRESLTRRGRILAPRFAPGGIYREPSPGIEGRIIEVCMEYPGFELDHDGMTVQINVETAGLQSQFWIERANPGGIGAIDGAEHLALWFNRHNFKADGNPVPREEAERRGLRAHACKLRNYRFGEGEWTAFDPRAAAIRQLGWMGSCRTWRDLKGKWATSQTYDTTMESLWTALETIIAEEPVAGDIPGVPFIPADARHFTKGRTADWPTELINHHTDGYDSLDWLTTSPNSNVSATYLANRDGTLRAQLVRHKDTPHTTGEFWNPRSLTMEWERKWPEQSFIPDGTYTNLGDSWARIIRAERARGNPHLAGPLRRDQMTCHKCEYPSYTCPGNLDIDRVYRATVRALADPVAPTDDRILVEGNPIGPYGYRLGFKGRLQAIGQAISPANIDHGILAWIGWAKEDEWQAVDGCSYQRCERGILQWTPNTPAPWDIVRMSDDDAVLPAPKIP